MSDVPIVGNYAVDIDLLKLITMIEQKTATLNLDVKSIRRKK